jgi:hypothetical protein
MLELHGLLIEWNWFPDLEVRMLGCAW